LLTYDGAAVRLAAERNLPSAWADVVRGPWLPRCDYRWDLHWFGNDKNHASVATADGADLVDREVCRFQTDGSLGDVEQVRADIEHVAAANPAVVLALLDRIEALEKAAPIQAVHSTDCGCLTCRREHPQRFAAPRDP